MLHFSLLLFYFISFAAEAKTTLPGSSKPSATLKSVVAEQAPSMTTFNAILFSEGNQSWTTRDFNLYKKLVHHLTHQDKLSLQADSSEYDFMMSRLLRREALLFEIKPKKYEFSIAAHPDLADYSKAEIKDEVETIELASALLDLKEKQMSQKARFKAWVDVLKRKYNVKLKANEFVN